MKLLPAILLAISSNLDNTGIGTSYGIRRIGLPFRSNLIVAIITTAGTILSMCMGSLVARYIPAHLAVLTGSSIIAGAGAWVILQSWREPDGPGAPVSAKKPAPRPQEDENLPSRAKKLVEFHIKSLGLFIQILREPWTADMDLSRKIEGREAFLLAIALTINNLAGGFGGGIVGIDIPLTAAMVFVFSLLTLAGSVRFGHQCLSRWLGRWAGLIAGLILIAVGLYEFFS
ncbi:manganese efflux pump [Desulfotomaculum copahuensis]|uniref:Sporulation membrane protein YtaF n=1 Tax=Desulfotomaculum copahuensis TaxID=1838280 RepID=A0A1B7LIK1_9FIRM|nr:manganese efflux pump [Desulfotomaculum copahuensis]OAT86394.1 hypothetical protein A6M21_02910 [Desulfotomaculum copahuensis]